MRILIANSTGRRIGGAEDYLCGVIPALVASGHELGFVWETDTPASHESIPLPEGAPRWDVSKLGGVRTLQEMRSWKPDLTYAHGKLNTEFEAGLLQIAPAIYFSHNYYGTCISGLKSFKFPVIRPCNRQFGAACLVQYFPRHCGGRSPLTMWRLFQTESKRLANLHEYRAIVTHSNHMRKEYIRNGFPEAQVHNFVSEVAVPFQQWSLNEDVKSSQVRLKESGFPGWNLLFVGRMELLKGGGTLLDALPSVTRQLGKPIRLLLAGDGPERKVWERKAAKLKAKHPSLEINFAGWVSRERLDEIYSDSDLLVVPSLWPEPFGRIGPEAGLHGVPVVAFEVGGVPDWLMEGVNGHMAPGDPPTAAGLVEAITNCLRDPVEHLRLRKGALAVAGKFNLSNHLEALYEVFNRTQNAAS